VDLNTYLEGKENQTELIKTMNEISNEFTQVKIKFQIKFWNDLLDKLGRDVGFEFGNENPANWKKCDESISEACQKYYTNSQSKRYYGILHNFGEFKLILIVNHDIYFDIQHKTNDENSISRKNKTIQEMINDKEKNYWFYPKTGTLNFKEFNDTLIDALSGDNRQKTIKNLADEFKELVAEIKICSKSVD
jgi:hypothetical protein